MDTVTISAIASSIAAILAIVAPIVTAILNNRYHLKLKKYENYELHKQEIVEGFLNSSEKYLFERTSSSYTEFLSYKSRIYIYVDKELWVDLSNMIAMIEDCRNENINDREFRIAIAKKEVKYFCQKLAARQKI